MPGQGANDHDIVITVPINILYGGKSPFSQVMPSRCRLTKASDGVAFVIEYVNTFPTCNDNIFFVVIIHVSYRYVRTLHELVIPKPFFKNHLFRISFVNTDAYEYFFVEIGGNTKTIVRLNPIVLVVSLKQLCVFYILQQ